MQAAEAFRNEQYLNLETVRKNGVAVQTPVWFVQDGDTILVRTVTNSGKVKRVRRNSQVRIAPCDSRGQLKGDWFAAQAHLADSETAARANRLLQKKYGLMKAAFELMGKMRGTDYTTIVIQPAS